MCLIEVQAACRLGALLDSLPSEQACAILNKGSGFKFEAGNRGDDMTTDDMVRWADTTERLIEQLRVEDPYTAGPLERGARPAIAMIRTKAKAVADRLKTFEAKRQDPATSVETYIYSLGLGRKYRVRYVIERMTTASVWLQRLSCSGEAERFSIKSGKEVGGSRRIDWTTTTNADLLKARAKHA